jgi:hypothetical protein
VTGMTTDLNDTSSRTKASSSTNAKTQPDRCAMRVLKSAVPAVSPVTATRTPGTRPSVAGMTLPRRVASALIDARSSPVPASGTWMIAAVRAELGMNVIGWFICPVASAARSKARPAAATAGAVTSRASTTTTAGAPPPGNTCWIRLYVCRAAVSCGRSLAPGVAVSSRSTGSASATRAHNASAAVSAGRDSTRSSTAVQTRPRSAAACRPRPANGRRPRSTRSPSKASRAGSRVSDAMTATATTSMVAWPIPEKILLPVRNMPPMASSTVSPEISTERPEVAAAASIASSTGRPAARSSRWRLT